MPTSFRLEKDFSKACRGQSPSHTRNWKIKELEELSHTHVSIQDLPPLLGVVQRRDGQVGDGHVSRGRERDQQHHEPSGLLQRQLQVMSVLLGQGGEIQLAAAAAHGLTLALQSHTQMQRSSI